MIRAMARYGLVLALLNPHGIQAGQKKKPVLIEQAKPNETSIKPVSPLEQLRIAMIWVKNGLFHLIPENWLFTPKGVNDFTITVPDQTEHFIAGQAVELPSRLAESLKTNPFNILPNPAFDSTALNEDTKIVHPDVQKVFKALSVGEKKDLGTEISIHRVDQTVIFILPDDHFKSPTLVTVDYTSGKILSVANTTNAERLKSYYGDMLLKMQLGIPLTGAVGKK